MDKKLLVIAALFFAVGCGSELDDSSDAAGGKSDDFAPVSHTSVKNYNLEELEAQGYYEAGREITAARIEGDTLIIDVSYGGGCEEHDFVLHWDGAYLESLPPQVNLTLYHDFNNDFCEGFLHSTLEFDLSGFAGDGPLIVNLTGSEKSLEYSTADGGDTPTQSPTGLFTADPAELETDGFRVAGSIIQNARLEGTTLELDVAYGGGCEEHEFRLHWDGVWLESLPPQTSLTLYHNANNDFCEAFLSETLTFDLSQLAGEPVVLHLTGTEISLTLGGGAEPQPDDGVKDLYMGDVNELQAEGYAPAGRIIQNATIEGDELHLDVTFGGGCEEHSFEVSWDGLILESFPPQVNLVLHHASNNDFCEALLRETVVVDLSPLDGDGELFINLAGSNLNALKYGE